MSWHASFTALAGSVTRRSHRRAPDPRHHHVGPEEIRDRVEYDRTLTHHELPPPW